jgi:mRNA interferase ChpB
VLVVSPAPFNQLTKTPIVVPISTGGQFSRVAGFAVELVGTKTTGIVRCDQPRTLDLGARKAKRVETVSAAVIDDVLAKLATLVT